MNNVDFYATFAHSMPEQKDHNHSTGPHSMLYVITICVCNQLHKSTPFCTWMIFTVDVNILVLNRPIWGLHTEKKIFMLYIIPRYRCET